MYIIKITKQENREYQTNDYQKVADSGNKSDGGAVYAHVPVTKIIEKEVDVLTMSVEKINLKNIVAAILKAKL